MVLILPQALAPGILLLGAVQEILEYEVLISLPFNMRGAVPLTDVSDPITQLAESEAESENDVSNVWQCAKSTFYCYC